MNYGVLRTPCFDMLPIPSYLFLSVIIVQSQFWDLKSELSERKMQIGKAR